MKLNCSILDHAVVFDENVAFSRDFESRTSGTRYTAITLPGESVVAISAKGVKPETTQGAAAENVLQLPIRDKIWNVEIDHLSHSTLISIGGQRPELNIGGQKRFISAGGQRPEEATDTFKIKLKADYGSWRVQLDTSGTFLNVSFKEIEPR